MTLKKEIKLLLLIVVIVFAGTLTAKMMVPKITKKTELDLAIDKYVDVENNTNDKILKDFSIINENKDTLLLSSLLTYPKLIYRFSELHCDSCINHEFVNLRKQITSDGLELKDVIIICYYQNHRNMNIFKRINKLQDFEVYNLMNDNVGDLEIEDIGVPYFFVIDSEFKISNTFIPLKEVNQRTDDYLKRVSNLFK